MTVEEAKKKVIALARAEVGYREGPDNQNKYADDPRITKLYGWSVQNQPWCCTFVSWLFLNCFGDIGGQMTYGGSAACANQAGYYKKNGAFFQSPEIGDQVFFYSNYAINHTGIVVEVNGGSIRTVEGNYSDKVSLCSYAAGNPVIAGYGRPKWSLAADAQQSQEEDKPQSYLDALASLVNGTTVVPTSGNAGGSGTVKPKEDDSGSKEDHGWTLPELSRSITKTNWNVLLQALLIARRFGCKKYGADGYFGAETQEAVVSARKFYGLKDGVTCDGELWAKLLKTEAG